MFGMGPCSSKKSQNDKETSDARIIPKRGNVKVAPELGRLLATYQLIPSFQKLERLNCYVDSLDRVDQLPVPTPPSCPKSDIFDPNDYRTVDRRAESAPSKLLKQPLSALVEYLIEGYEDDLSKIRVIYRWITAQSLERLNIGKKEPPQSHTLFQLWRIKHRKGNYAQLVSLLCRFAQLPCIIIHGKLKGSTYEVGEKLDDEQHYGEWNAVLVNNEWRFINAYWGTCAEGGSGDTTWEVVDRGGGDHVNADPVNKQLFYSCDENYFLTDPDQMVSTHLPNVPEWQLKKVPVADNDFEETAFLKDRYFNLNLRLQKPQKCVVLSATGETELRFELPADTALNLDFQYLLFRLKRSSAQGSLHRYDRYVFLQRASKNVLSIRIRSPVADTFRFELVGKDITLDDSEYDYDWVTIYKLIFSAAKENCEPFPECPVIGWGPGRGALECGVAPLSHFGGEIRTKNNGTVEIKFKSLDGTDLSKKSFRAELVKGGKDGEVLTDCVVHRIENGEVIFDVNTPKSGEYALKLYAKDPKDKEEQNFCNYLINSEQTKENYAFPRGFQDALGEKDTFNNWGLKALTHPSGLIETDEEELVLEFENEQNIDLSLNLSGGNIRPEMAKRLVTEERDGNITRFRVRFPQNGNFGIKIMGNKGNKNKNVFDYVVKYKKGKKKHTPRQEVEVDKPKDNLPVISKKSAVPDELRERIRNTIHDRDDVELELAIEDLKALELPATKPDIEDAERELDIIKCRKELVEATEEKDMDAIKQSLKTVKDKGYEDRMLEEVVTARAMLDRLRNINKLMHAVLALDQKTIAEIKGYQNPPPAVHRVMMATLLLLGHWEEETEDWKNVQIALGKMGKESLKRRIQQINLDGLELDVALGARDLIRDFSLDQVRMVSAGGATFYIWVKGIVEELEKRNAEIIGKVRPRTSNKRRRERTIVE